jgi:UDP-N-acetylmuramyl pentapeptide synthase
MLWPQHCAEKFIMANALWTAQELVAATGGTLMGHVRLPLNGVAIDSRVIAAGDIFVAIKGDKMDGHDFVVNALKAGAGVAVVSHVSEEMKGPCCAQLEQGKNCCCNWQCWQNQHQGNVAGCTWCIG